MGIMRSPTSSAPNAKAARMSAAVNLRVCLQQLGLGNALGEVVDDQ
jgi:hypothetical protein